ncbi:MAG: NADH/ubiquinone/plastoquinone (complex I), partial [Gammaproteobacteria bacterium]|nr:NADH/ubiquinone/plastoquinone (complex I) [Gammaproteobacteria bacterium]
MMSIDVQTLIPLFVAIPLGMSLLIQLLARNRHVLAEVLTIAAMLVLTAMSCYTVGNNGIYHLGGWPTPIGIDMRLDGLATLLLLAVNIVGFAVSLYSVDYMRQFTARSHFYSLFLLMVTGMNGVILAGDLFNLYVFLEIAAIASYSLVAFGCAHE